MKTSGLITFFIILLIFVMSVYIQIHALFNMDVSMLMHVSDRMLNGGVYGVDIFESNPPLILYVYAIPVWMAKLFSINYIVSCQVFLYFLILLSIFLCCIAIKDISRRVSFIYKNYVLLPATAGVLLFPGIYFAQKEHIMLILILPYVYCSIATLYGITIQRYYNAVVTVLAGIGFCIKPHFFIPFFIYLFYRRKVSIDNIVIVVMALLYFLMIVIFYPTYFTEILPLVAHYYYPYFDFRFPWANVGLWFSLTILVVYAISAYIIKNSKLENVLAIYVMGFIIVYVSQKSNWGYHLYPAIAFVMILAIQLVYRYMVLIAIYYPFKKQIYLWLLCFIFSGASIVLLRYPIKYYLLINNKALSYQSQSEYKIISHLKTLKDVNSIYFLSNNPSLYPTIDYLNLKDNQIIQCYWFFPGLGTIDNIKSNYYLNYFNRLIVQSLILKKPDVIVLSTRLFPGKVQNYSLEFFLKNDEFKKFFIDYKKVDAYDEVIIFKKSILKNMRYL